MSLVASPGFDASVWEIWPTLAAGASLHVPDDEVRSSPALLLRWLAVERITVSFLPTPLAEAVVAEALAGGELPAGLALRTLLTGGDRLRVAPARRLPFELVNHYGPTESTVVATAAPVAIGGARAPAIGRPIAGLEISLLDRRGRPVPVGVPGEIRIGGAGSPAATRRQPALTAERFVPAASRRAPGSASTAPAISPAAVPTANWISSAGSTSR